MKRVERPTVLLGETYNAIQDVVLSILYCLVMGAPCHHRNLQHTSFSTQMLRTQLVQRL